VLLFTFDSPETLNLLSLVSAIDPRHVREQTLPMLFGSLPDLPPDRTAVIERTKCFRILDVLSRLCLQAELFETLVIRMLAKLDLICVSVKQADVADEPAIAYAHALLSTLAKTLDKKVEQSDPDVPKYIDRLVPGLLNLLIWSSLVPSSHVMPSSDIRVIQMSAKIVTLVTRTLAVEYVVFSLTYPNC
jgi:DNA repair/transcription protein MET18/MMS19